LTLEVKTNLSIEHKTLSWYVKHIMEIMVDILISSTSYQRRYKNGTSSALV